MTINSRMTSRKITNHLLLNRGYFKWGIPRLAAKYGVTERTISNIVKNLSKEKQEYLRN
jgi:hypothetical protein